MKKGLGFVQFYVRFVDEIRPDLQTGKKRPIIKHCNISKDNFVDKGMASMEEVV